MEFIKSGIHGVAAIWLCGLLVTAPVQAGGQTIRLEKDSNSRLEIKDAVFSGKQATVLFWTWPDRGDPDFRNDCGKNYYTVTLTAGLPTAEPRLMAGGACAGGGSLLQGGLLADGSGKFVVQDRLEHWKDGERLSVIPFAKIEHIGSLRIRAADMGSQFIDFSPSGDLVLAVAVSGYAAPDWPGTPLVLAGLDADNQKRWLLAFEESAAMLMPKQIWAGANGGALFHYETVDTTAIAADAQTRLLHISAAGDRTEWALSEVAQPYDIMSMQPGSQEDLQKAMAHMQENRSEAIDSLGARGREDGGFDVLYERESDQAGRDGYFLLRLDRKGRKQSETALGSVVDDHGLEQWKDFYVNGGELVLLSNVVATQTGVNSRRKTWPQTAVARISLDSLAVDARLIPLERQYLEAAMNAGDEGQQYLEGKPGGRPVMLTRLGGTPVSLSQGWVRKRGTLRVFEATEALVAFTEYRDRQLAQREKEEQRVQRKVQRKTSQEQMRQDMAAAAGLSVEEYESLSKEEQAMRMMEGGDMEAMMAAVMQQAQQQSAGMSPEQAAQMNAAMAQVQQMMQGGGAGMPAQPSAVAATPEADSKTTFSIDALMRGHVQYRHPSGQPVTLSFVNRDSGAELMKREFPGGVIDEYFSLGSHGLPSGQIGAVIRDAGGAVLADLEPE